VAYRPSKGANPHFVQASLPPPIWWQLCVAFHPETKKIVFFLATFKSNSKCNHWCYCYLAARRHCLHDMFWVSVNGTFLPTKNITRDTHLPIFLTLCCYMYRKLCCSYFKYVDKKLNSKRATVDDCSVSSASPPLITRLNITNNKLSKTTTNCTIQVINTQTNFSSTFTHRFSCPESVTAGNCKKHCTHQWQFWQNDKLHRRFTCQLIHVYSSKFTANEYSWSRTDDGTRRPYIRPSNSDFLDSWSRERRRRCT